MLRDCDDVHERSGLSVDLKERPPNIVVPRQVVRGNRGGNGEDGLESRVKILVSVSRRTVGTRPSARSGPHSQDSLLC
jgi:hypothetical protein